MKVFILEVFILQIVICQILKVLILPSVSGGTHARLALRRTST